jgi:hypothetical protein
MATDACAICCEPFNKTVRAKVACNGCALTACKSCVTTYLLGTTQNAHCMGCKAGWSRDHMYNVLPSSFVNGKYTKHRGDLLFEREKALLAETMPLAILKRKHKDLIKKINHHLQEVRKLQLEKMKARMENNNTLVKNLCSRIQDMRKRYFELDNEKRYVTDDILEIEHPDHVTWRKKEPKTVKYIRPCGLNDCRGFVNTGNVCTMCNIAFCRDCHEVNDPDHTCKAEDIETAKAIKKDSKPCPNCHVTTFRMSGCPQMWCTICHTLWDWNTCAIETGKVIHNPHYFEYMRNKHPDTVVPRNDMQDPPAGGHCQERWLTIGYEMRGTIKKFGIPTDQAAFTTHMYNLAAHVAGYELPRCATNMLGDNKDLRVKFLLKDIDEAGFKRYLCQREKMVAKKEEYERIFNMFNTVTMDLMLRFARSDTKEEALGIEKEFVELCAYFNTTIQKVGTIYKCKYPKIDTITRTMV